MQWLADAARSLVVSSAAEPTLGEGGAFTESIPTGRNTLGESGPVREGLGNLEDDVSAETGTQKAWVTSNGRFSG
jgi:hypothetical protein